ncbi:MAG TPA: Clp protease ClpP [Candidatus Gemmiger excrementavium]|uniref:ATP-dependent Clp protease proteolytic subunit n=1 Tax=Candidatus Gemmiger excrementavium TaxID=2838608 RepID=A0A9D2F1X7_9FIRM|nr:Clp protease ClpP [Candidatus Gemmiger excrementavium]
MKNKQFFAIQQLDRGADIYIFGDLVSYPLTELGEVSGMSIVNQIENLDVDEIRVHIDSYGGLVSEGWSIYDALRRHPAKIVTYGDGFVASAALYPFLAGDERIASSLSAYYFHQVMVSASGYADDLRAAAEKAEKMTEIGINAFVERTGMDADQVRQLMQAETWMTPAQALDYGLATSITSDGALPIAQDAKRAVMQRVLQADKPAAPAAVPPTNTASVGPAPRQAMLADQIKNMI